MADSINNAPQGENQNKETSSENNEKFLNTIKKIVNGIESGLIWLYKKTDALFRSPWLKPKWGIHMLDELLAWARSKFPPEKYDALSSTMSKAGHTGILAAEIITLIFFIIASIVLKDWIYIIKGIGFAAALIILQYTAERFMNAGDSLIKASPSKMNSGAFLDCLALVIEIAGILLFITYIIKAKNTESWSFFFTGLGVWALCDCIAYIAINPSMANTTIQDEGTAGEEAIGIMSFFVKAIIRIVPLAFGIGTIIGSVALFIAIFSLIKHESVSAGMHAIRLIAFCTCLPFATYLVFVFYHLTIDIIRSLLAISERKND